MLGGIYYFTTPIEQDNDTVSYKIVVPGFDIIQQVEGDKDSISSTLVDVWNDLKAQVDSAIDYEYKMSINKIYRDHIAHVIEQK